jgi:peptide/nickel transport system permease protein
MSTEQGNKETTVDKNENEIALRETEGLSQGQIIFRRFVRHKAAMSSLIVLIFIILFSYTGSGIHLGDSNNKINTR